MIESERFEEIIKKVNCENSSEVLKTLADKGELLSLISRLPSSEKLKAWSDEIKNSERNKKQNEHDMLQANQANLKCSTSYPSNIKQVINLNSTLHERYHKLQKLSLHHILSKGNKPSKDAAYLSKLLVDVCGARQCRQVLVGREF